MTNPMLPTDLNQLQAMIAAGTFPGMAPAPRIMSSPALPATPPQSMSADEVRAIVRQELAAVQSQHPVMAKIDAIFKQALSPEDLAAFEQYIASGSPGFDDLLASDKLHPLAQLMWETIKENVK